MTNSNYYSQVAVLGKINMGKIEAVLPKDSVKKVIEVIDWKEEVEEMLDYCDIQDSKWLNSESHEFLIQLRERFSYSNSRPISDKQEVWLKRIWIEFSRQ